MRRSLLIITCVSLVLFVVSTSASVFDKAVEAFELKQYEQAIEYYTQALQYLQNNHKPNEHYDKISKEIYNKFYVFYMRGECYKEIGEYGNAISDYSKCIELSTYEYDFVYEARGYCYGKKGNYDLAIKDMTKAIELDPKNELAFTNRGSCYGENGDFDLAISDYTKAIELKPTAICFYGRGWCYDEKGEFDLAIVDLNKAIKLDPVYAYAYNDRGWIYAQKDEYSNAIKDLTKAIEIKPSEQIPYNNRGYCYAVIGEYSLAIKDFTKAIELDPKYQIPLFHRGVLYYRMEKHELAEKDFAMINEIDKEKLREEVKGKEDDPIVQVVLQFDYLSKYMLPEDEILPRGRYESRYLYYWWSLCQLKKEEFYLADDFALKAVIDDSTNACSYVLKATTTAHYHNFNGYALVEAVDYMTKAIELAPNKAEFYEIRGKYYFDAGYYCIVDNIEKAKQDWLKAHALDPEYPKSPEARKAIGLK